MKSARHVMSDLNVRLNAEGISVYSIENRGYVLQNSQDGNFYIVSLLSGTGCVQYGSHAIEINGSVLLLSKPGTAYAWRLEPADHPSYTCMMTEAFLDKICFQWMEHSKFSNSEIPLVFDLTSEQSHFLRGLYRRMIKERETNYRFKSHLTQNQICILLHVALRMRPSENFTNSVYAPSTSPTGFVKLIEMQFPPEAQLVHFN